MAENKSFTNNSVQGSTDQKAYPAANINKPLISGIITFVLLSFLFSLLIYQRYQLAKAEMKKEAYEIVNQKKVKLQELLIQSLSATKILTFFINNEGQVNNFDSIAAQILESDKNIDALQLLPDGVVQYVYPLKENEKVIGYNIIKDTATNTEANKPIDKTAMFFKGPFELKQGGTGLVGSLPVYRKNKFWGFSAVVIKMSTLFKAADIDSAGKDGYYFQLSKTNPITKEEAYFLPQHKEYTNHHAVSVNVLNEKWNLSVTKATDYQSFGDILLLALLCFVLSVLGAIFIYRFAIRPKRLNELVIKSTRELKASETNYRSLIERVSDAFVALNNKWEFTYVNEKASEILLREPKSLIGKNIWTEFPEGVDKPFYHAYYRAMKTQEYQYLEEYYQPFNKWLENHIYPSTDGLTIFFKDVTDIKHIALSLKKNEEKYRSLIEQASDGIVITDLDGIILEVNNSVLRMFGFSEDEMIGYHITKYIPEEDISVIPLRINELMKGKSLIYERRILKKDGNLMAVEMNTKMASSHTFIGFIRDITERKKHENTLLYQARLLESVSDAITSLDMNRNIVSWNKACEELYGFRAEEVTGKKIPELVTFEYPETTNEEVFKKVYSTGQWKGEFNFIHPKSKLKIYLLSSINILKNNDGKITGFIITSSDITERKITEEAIKKSNERFELIAQATNDAVWDHDFVKNETWGNNKLYTLYGLEKGNAKINYESFMERIHPDERAGVEEKLKRTIDNKANSLAEEFRFKTANGEYRDFYDRAFIKYNEEGRPLRILGTMEDITEREIIKKQVIKEKELSDSIINSLPGVFYLFNKEGRYLRWNKNFETVTGYTGEEIRQMHPLQFFDTTDHPLLTAKIANVFVAGKDEVKADFLLKNKQKVLYYFNGLAIEYEGESCLMGVGIDFSEREKAEQLIKESEEKYRTLVEQASDGIFIADNKGHFIVVNNSGFNMSQYTGEELKNMSIFDLVLPEDLEKKPFNFSDMMKGKVTRSERRMKRKDGTLLDVEVTAKFISGERFLAFIRDISERKKAEEKLLQSEQKYRLLFYNNPLPMWMVTMPGLDIIDVNDAAIKQYGYSREEFLQLNTRQLRPAEDVENFLKEVDKMEPGRINIRNWRHKKKDGSVIHVETYSHPIMYEGKWVWLGLSHDITKEYLAKELLEKSYEDIRQLASNLQSIREDERTNMAREIHDELGQQLTGLKMDLHWLTRKINSTDGEVTEKMKESIELINATIASVRKISTDLRPSILDDLGLIAALEWQSEEFEKRSGTRVEFTNKAGDITVKPAVTTAIFRIYQELLTNIARHANAGLVTALLQKENDKLYFRITDNGTGFNLESISNKKTLGLLGIKERTLLLGGTYEFKSKQGEGSETIIAIPLIG